MLLRLLALFLDSASCSELNIAQNTKIAIALYVPALFYAFVLGLITSHMHILSEEGCGLHMPVAVPVFFFTVVLVAIFCELTVVAHSLYNEHRGQWAEILLTTHHKRTDGASAGDASTAHVCMGALE